MQESHYECAQRESRPELFIAVEDLPTKSTQQMIVVQSRGSLWTAGGLGKHAEQLRVPAGPHDGRWREIGCRRVCVGRQKRRVEGPNRSEIKAEVALSVGRRPQRGRNRSDPLAHSRRRTLNGPVPAEHRAIWRVVPVSVRGRPERLECSTGVREIRSHRGASPRSTRPARSVPATTRRRRSWRPTASRVHRANAELRAGAGGCAWLRVLERESGVGSRDPSACPRCQT
jgi:hypothetical protein